MMTEECRQRVARARGRIDQGIADNQEDDQTGIHDEGRDQDAALDEQPRRETEKRHLEDELEVEDAEMQEENGDGDLISRDKRGHG